MHRRGWRSMSHRRIFFLISERRVRCDSSSAIVITCNLVICVYVGVDELAVVVVVV